MTDVQSSEATPTGMGRRPVRSQYKLADRLEKAEEYAGDVQVILDDHRFHDIPEGVFLSNAL
jgi:hypothetical protein